MRVKAIIANSGIISAYNLHIAGFSVNDNIITGIVWLAIPVLVMYIAKIIHFDGVNVITLFPVWVLAAVLNVIMQELLVRGYLYQMVKQEHNIVAATIVTTALFTALHGGALEAGVVPVLNVLTMSLLMTIVPEYSGSIIAPTIMHFIWNGIGALVLGGVSLADDYPKLLITTFTGNEILSGGVCRIEESIIVLFVNVILTSMRLLYRKISLLTILVVKSQRKIRVASELSQS